MPYNMEMAYRNHRSLRRPSLYLFVNLALFLIRLFQNSHYKHNLEIVCLFAICFDFISFILRAVD